MVQPTKERSRKKEMYGEKRKNRRWHRPAGSLGYGNLHSGEDEQTTGFLETTRACYALLRTWMCRVAKILSSITVHAGISSGTYTEAHERSSRWRSLSVPEPPLRPKQCQPRKVPDPRQVPNLSLCDAPARARRYDEPVQMLLPP